MSLGIILIKYALFLVLLTLKCMIHSFCLNFKILKKLNSCISFGIVIEIEKLLSNAYVIASLIKFILEIVLNKKKSFIYT